MSTEGNRCQESLLAILDTLALGATFCVRTAQGMLTKCYIKEFDKFEQIHIIILTVQTLILTPLARQWTISHLLTGPNGVRIIV